MKKVTRISHEKVRRSSDESVRFAENQLPSSMTTKPLSIRLLFSLLSLFVAVSGIAKEVPHIVFEGTESPNGRYAVAWGIPYTMLDTSDMDKIMENLDYDAIRNFLVDLKSGEQIATLDTTYFESKNHGGLSALWRNDSGALMLVEGGKWGALSASVVYIVEPEKEYDQCSDVIPVTLAIRRAVKIELLKMHAKHADTIQNFEISMRPLRWIDENKVRLEITGQVPKGDDSFSYEGEMDVNLPGPMSVSIGGNADVKSPDQENASSDTLITANSVGPIKLGMTIAQARANAPGTIFERTSDGEGIAKISVQEGGEELMTIYAGEEDPDSKINENAEIVFIEVWSPLLKTAEGIKPGMTISQAEKTIGDLREIFMSEIESREFASFTDQPSGMTFRVTHDRGSAGKYRGDTMTTTRCTPGATILSIEVSGSDIMQDGSIGGIMIGATEPEVLAIAEKEEMGNPFKGKDEMWEAFGQAVQPWLFPDAGISIDMISDEIGGPKTVLSITAKAGSKAATGKDISMGAQKADVIKAYADYRTEKEEMSIFPEEDDIHLVGSIYGGMIFTFEKGELAKIFLGAAAE